MDSNSIADLSWYKTLCTGFNNIGLDGAALCIEAGIYSAVVDQLPAGGLSDAMSVAFEIAVARTGDPHIGLRMARHPLGALGVLSHMLFASNNPQESLQFLARYLPLFWPMATVDFQTSSDRSLLVLGIVPGRRCISSSIFDFFASMVIAGSRIVSGKRAKILKMYHPGDAPLNPLMWHQSFGDVVEFGAPRCAIELVTASMLLPIPTANPAILELSERIAEQMQRRTVGVTSDRIRRDLVKSLHKGEAHRKEIATHLGMSERSLCRRLSEEGTTYLNLLDSVRREMAESYIQQGGFNPTEITFALGFSDPSNFYRACKRWFGHTPTLR